MKIFQFQNDGNVKKYVEIKNCGVLQPFTKKRSLLTQVLNAANELPRDTLAILVFSTTERIQISSFGKQLVGDAMSPNGLGYADCFPNLFLEPNHLAITIVPADEADKPIVAPREGMTIKDLSKIKNVLVVGRL
jgi:hypothetical protein